MKIYQEWMLKFWLLLYFTKPLEFNQQSSRSTISSKYGSRLSALPRNSEYVSPQKFNYTSEHVPELKHQTYRKTTHSNEHTSAATSNGNFTFSSSEQHRTKEELMSASDEYHWPRNLKNSPTFFYTHVEPHRFEYRAMFQHNNNGFKPENFNPFVHDFPPFPKGTFPPFPKFPTFPTLFEHKEYHDEVPPFRFPTVPPSIRRILQPSIVEKAVQIPRPISHENLDGPLKKYDVVLGNIDAKYPKIFRFNDERMNIVDFEKQKKMKLKLGGIGPNSISGSEYVPREQFLILHGGIFTVQEPPLYNQNSIRKRKLTQQRNSYKALNE